MTYDPSDTGPNDNNADGKESFEAVTTEDAVISREFNFDYSEEFPHQYRELAEVPMPISIRQHPQASNPVLEGSDVTDITSPEFVADPFLVYEGGSFYMFFEVYGDSGNEKYNAYATSPNGLNWTYQSIISNLSDMSYPFVFKYNGEWYMTPENAPGEFRIYKATDFPSTWSLEETPISSYTIKDPTPFRYNDRWWAILCDLDDGKKNRLWYSDTLIGGTWTEHPQSPIDSGTSPGGRPIVQQDYVDMITEDPEVKRITNLDTSTFDVNRTGNLQGNKLRELYTVGWLARGTHHMDILSSKFNNGLVVFDGLNPSGNWSIGMGKIGEQFTPTPAKIYKTSTQTIATGTSTLIDFDDLAYNEWGGLDTTATAGYYILDQNPTVCNLKVRLEFTDITNAPFLLEVWLQGGGSLPSDFEHQYIHVEQNNDLSVTIDTDLYKSVGDFAKLRVQQDSGANITIKSGKHSSYYSIKRVRSGPER